MYRLLVLSTNPSWNNNYASMISLSYEEYLHAYGITVWRYVGNRCIST